MLNLITCVALRVILGKAFTILLLVEENKYKHSFDNGNFHELSTLSLNGSGDQDMKISYIGTLEWIEMLNISITENWRPWFVNGEVAG